MKFKLASLLPGFTRKPGKPQSKPAPVITVAAPEIKTPIIPTPAPDPEPPNSSKAQKMLDDICSFLARYLQCSPPQRHVLALWILHTHCFAAAKATPYLAIQSAYRLSGKTLCLRLLSLLCANPALTSGYTASTLVHRIHSHPQELPTFLLDECSATVGSGSRAKNPKLRSILASGFQPGIGYSDRSTECAIFSPKAFATMGPLPEPLSDCSIPIILRPLNTRVAPAPGSPAPGSPTRADVARGGVAVRAGVARDGVEVPSPVSSATTTANDQIERFDLSLAQQEAKPLVAALQNWARKNLSALKAAPALKRKDFPSRLTARGQDITEPLLHLADALSGAWPERARKGLLAAFDDEDDQQRANRILLLRDIRKCFKHHNWPDGLHSRLLLEWLHALPARPWDADGPITDRRLAKMLWPHGICSTSVRMDSRVARGYRKNDFATPWNNLLDSQDRVAQPPSAGSSQNEARVAQPPGSPARAGVARDGVEVPSAGSSQNEARVAPPPPAGSSSKPTTTPASTSQKPNNDAACSTVTDARTITPQAPASPLPARPEFPLPSRKRPASEAQIDRHINGILDDPAHYDLDYSNLPFASSLRAWIQCGVWPQPADDAGPAYQTLPTADNTPIPFTLVKRDPKDPTDRFLFHQQDARWPVKLTEEQKLQVACARFVELYIALRSQREKDKQAQASTTPAA